MGTQARSGGEVSANPDVGDLYSHLTDAELRARLRQHWCSEDVDYLVAHRSEWPATDAINRWLRS